MTTFEAIAIINKPINEVYLFLADLNNHQQLMPETVQSWLSTADEASFNVQNMLKLSLKIDYRIENAEIRIIPLEKPPFDLEIKWVLSLINDQTQAVLTIWADLNMMMKMMASGPLQKLADHEAEALKKTLS